MAAALAFPLAASAGNDKTSGAKSASAHGNDGGAEAMFTSMDKNGDGFISKEEAAGTPHAADFAKLDKNGDGKLSRDEHFAAKEHVAARAKAGSTASSADSTSSSADASSSKKTY
jgi:Ca2+-binding EF-hand superfamily protein